MRLLVTGGQGFVSSQFIKLLQREGIEYIRHVRTFGEKDDFVADLTQHVDWLDALCGIDVVVHCAALVHQPDISLTDTYHAVNVEGTLTLAQQAANSGVKRFVFLSSIKVNGEKTETGCPFTERVTQPPSDLYGKSKYLAEQGLREIAKSTGMEVVIIRPPLVYGPGVKANFRAMMSWVKKGIPLPFGITGNARSLVYIHNLTDFILLCCTSPKAANQTFLVSDGVDVSTSQLLSALSDAMGKKSRLLPVPKCIMTSLLSLAGKKAVAHRLYDNLQMNIEHARSTLDWQPPFSFEQGIQETVDDFMKNGER
ncbi:UDP-glucose 4-epimerase family protein [Grimontia hollisae]|uniref:UDP-glucose 4-epimerase family protein n=1 Tax=Grimontia hollisae TaxID=673 RepID=UPI001303C2F3|nr:SDR family oxidoreductase [Grimontia hollisae]